MENTNTEGMQNNSKNAPIATLVEIDYKEIIDTMLESVWIGDSNERTVYANPNLLRMLGYTLEELLGEESYIFWDEEGKKTVQANNKLRQQGLKSKYEGNVVTKHGDSIPVLLSGTPLRNGGTAAMMTDLREIRAVREESEHYQELSKIKDEFISMAGHELRTPMTGIRGYLSMILDGDAGEITEQTEKFLRIILKESERLILLINDMLDIAKLEAGKMDFTDTNIQPATLVTEVHDSLKFLAVEKGIMLICDIDDAVMSKYIHVDSAKLKQVLINIAGNALKFTPA